MRTKKKVTVKNDLSNNKHLFAEIKQNVVI